MKEAIETLKAATETIRRATGENWAIARLEVITHTIYPNRTAQSVEYGVGAHGFSSTRADLADAVKALLQQLPPESLRQKAASLRKQADELEAKANAQATEAA